MSISPATRGRLAFLAVVGTLSGMSWCIAVMSWLCTFGWVWRLLGATRSCLASAGLAGRGHCWLCGMSRAFLAIWQGRFDAALSYNPHSLVLFGFMLLACVSIGLLWLPSRRNFRSETHLNHGAPTLP